MRVPLWPLLKDEIILDPALSKSGTFEEYVARLRRVQLIARQLAHDMAERSHAQNKAQHDKANSVAYKFYSVRTRVLVRRNDRQVLKNQKLAAAFEPAMVLRQVDDSTYLVRRYLRRFMVIKYTAFASFADILSKSNGRPLLALLPKSPHFTRKRCKPPLRGRVHLSLRTHLDHFLDSVGVCCFQPV